MISKFCADNKQHFAEPVTQSIAMQQTHLNQALARALDKLMRDRGISNNELGKRAKIAPNTIANYRRIEPAFTSKGKPQSAKLTEIEMIAAALDVNPLSFFSAAEDAPAKAQQTSLELKPHELDLIVAFRGIPDEEQHELLHDVMARAESIGQVVRRELKRLGHDVTGYVTASRAAEHLPKAPAADPARHNKVREDKAAPSSPTPARRTK
jgi:transcriptional regulator with XRE-family HTH domain